MTEIWKPVVGWEGLYEVSDLGRVRSLDRLDSIGRPARGRILISTPTGPWRKKYDMVDLYKDGKKRHTKVHKEVLRAFVGEKPAGCEARHLDGKTQNNALINLAWGSKAQNTADKAHHGTMARGASHGMAKLRARDVASIRRYRARGEKQQSIADRFGVSQAHVSRIVLEQSWKA